MTTKAIYRTIIPTVPESDIGSNGRLHYMVKARNTGDVDAIRQAWRALDVVTGEDDRNDG